MSENEEIQTEQEKLFELHNRLVNEYLQLLRSGKPLKASMLNTIRQFLRDQGITLSQIEQMKQEEQRHASFQEIELPFPGDEKHVEDYK
jgi:hypothetical protein